MEKQHIITVAALGPDSADLLTMGALHAMKQADALVLRTNRHGAAALLDEQGVQYKTLDALYERCEDFDELCAMAASALVKKALTVKNLCYAVSEPGSDATVRALAKALPQDVGMRVVGGVSLGAGAACAVIPFGVDTENLRTVTALSVDEVRVQADSPQVITEIDSRYIARRQDLALGSL